jgi:hypothetical protein
MRKTFVIVGVVLLSALTASATDIPQSELFLGYQFVRFNPANTAYFPSFNANGGGGQFAYHINKWFSGVVDAGAVTNDRNWDTTVADLMAGPRVTWHGHNRWVPFAQVLFGGAYSTTSRQITFLSGSVCTPTVTPCVSPLPPGVNPNFPFTARINASHTGFAMLAGGGIDVKWTNHFAFRPIEAEYYLTQLPNIFPNIAGSNNKNLNNFRYSAGLTFMFGAR